MIIEETSSVTSQTTTASEVTHGLDRLTALDRPSVTVARRFGGSGARRGDRDRLGGRSRSRDFPTLHDGVRCGGSKEGESNGDAEEGGSGAREHVVEAKNGGVD